MLLSRILKTNMELVLVRSSIQWEMRLGQGLRYKETLIGWKNRNIITSSF